MSIIVKVLPPPFYIVKPIVPGAQKVIVNVQGLFTKTSGGVSILPDATDADFTMPPNSAIFLPPATLTQDRNILIEAGQNGDSMEFYNMEQGFRWNLIGAPIYQADGSTVQDSVFALQNYLIRKISNQWRILVG